MHFKHTRLVPLLLLCCLGCLELPQVEEPSEPVPDSPPDAGIPPGFTLSATTSPQASVFQGNSHSFPFSITRSGGFSDSVSLTLSHPPPGVTAQPATIAAGSTSALLTVAVGVDVAPGSHALTVRAASGVLVQESTVELTVVRLGDLLVQWSSPSSGLVYTRGALPVQVLVEGGTADFVELLKGSTVLTRLSAPPYEYTWDTTQEPEGDSVLTARATRGSSSFTSPVRTIRVDRTAPSVSSRTPAVGATQVSVRASMEVTFSEPLKGSTVTDSSVVVSTGSGALAKTLSLSGDGRTLTVIPTASLPAPSTVTVTLGTASEPVTDFAGNPLAASSSWSFTVPAWLPMGGAISAFSGNTAAENVALKVGTDGYPVIAWAEFDGSAKNIHVQRWNGWVWESFGPGLSAIPGAGTNADEPALALDSSNRPVIVWQEPSTNNGPTNLYGKKWTGSGWTDLPAFDNLSNGQKRYEPDVVLNRADKVYSVSTSSLSAEYQAEVYWLNSGLEVWTIINAAMSGDFKDPKGPDLTVDASDIWYLLCDVESSSLGVRGIGVFKKSTQENWSMMGTAVISPAKNVARHGSIAVKDSGVPYITWEEGGTDSSTSHVYAAHWNGTSWQLLGTSVSSSTSTNTTPSLSIGHDGNPLIAWSGYAPPETSIWVKRWTGSTWSTLGAPLSAATGVSTAALKPVLALDINGQPLVAWQESDGTVSNIHVYRSNY